MYYDIIKHLTSNYNYRNDDDGDDDGYDDCVSISDDPLKV